MEEHLSKMVSEIKNLEAKIRDKSEFLRENVHKVSQEDIAKHMAEIESLKSSTDAVVAHCFTMINERVGSPSSIEFNAEILSKLKELTG